MKKNKVLFVLQHLVGGGVEKSLESLLECLDNDKWAVDILLLEPSTIDINLTSNARIIPFPSNQDKKLCSMYSRMLKIIKSIRQKDIYSILKYAISLLLHHGVITINRKLRRFDICAEYDYAVAYHSHQELTVYFTAIICHARYKYAWLHNDFASSGFRFSNLELLNNFNRIFCVSQSVQNEFSKYYPQYSSRTSLFYNVINSKLICNLSKIKIDTPWKSGMLKLLTIARLDYQKGIDIAIRTCKILVEKGINVQWCIIGEGDMLVEYQRFAKLLNLQSRILFLGYCKNPYPYIRDCDIYVQPSRHEGYGIAVAEARILCKPIVCTNFAGAYEQIKNKITGSIVECSPEKLACAIYDIHVSPSTKNMYRQNLKCENQDYNNDLVKKYFV